MGTEITTLGYFKDFWICFIYDIRSSIKYFLKKILGRIKHSNFIIKQRYSKRYAKKVVLKKKLAVTTSRKPSWFYTSFDRSITDPLTNYTLKFIEDTINKENKILITGCGTGINLFHLADCGFKELVGSDLLPECIDIANQLKNDFKYDNTRFIVDDGFNPSITDKFDLITALRWVFSAWMGNYGNTSKLNPFDQNVRDEALKDFLMIYSKLLNMNGMLIIELIDSVVDYRLAADHKLGDDSINIYPIRHSAEQVKKCAELNGFDVIDKKLSISRGHQPRTCYYLRKNN